MAVVIEDLTKPTPEFEWELNLPFVFTEIKLEDGLIAYTAVLGEKAYLNSNEIASVEGDLSEHGIYIIYISPVTLASRIYGGTVEFENENNLYYAVVTPDWNILNKLEPAQRWRFSYVSFEYPRRGKRRFLLPTINTSPFKDRKSVV